MSWRAATNPFWFSTVLFLAKCIVIFYFDLFRAPPVPMLLVTSIKISTWEKETPVLLQSTDLESSTFQTIESLFTLPLVLPGWCQNMPKLPLAFTRTLNHTWSIYIHLNPLHECSWMLMNVHDANESNEALPSCPCHHEWMCKEDLNSANCKLGRKRILLRRPIASTCFLLFLLAP